MDHRLREEEVALPGAAVQRIRYFDDANIRAAMDSALSRIPPDRRGVILRGRVDQDGGAAVLAARLNGMWSVGLIADYEKGGNWGVGFETTLEW